MFTKLFKNQNGLFSHRLQIFVFISLFLLIFFSILNHELWTDEAMILIVATELSFYQLLDYFRYIGYFPIDAILIKIFFILTGNKIFSLKFVTIIFFLLSFIILFKAKKIPFEIKILTLLSYPILAEFTLINRNYIFFIPAIFYLILEEEKKNKSLFFFLSLLNSVGPFGLIISFCYKICNYKFFFYNLNNKKLLIFLYSIFTFVCLYYFFPFDIETLDWKRFRQSSEYSMPTFEKIKTIIIQIILSINYIQHINKIDSIWSLYHSSYKINFFFLVIGFLHLSLIFLILFKNEKKILIFLILFIFLFILGLSVQPRGDWRHYFLFTAIFYTLNNKYLFEKKYYFVFLTTITKRIYIISLSISFFMSITFLYKDIFYDFSQGKNVANFIDINKIECNDITSYPPGASNSWIAYLKKNCKPLQFGLDEYNSFHKDLSKGRFLSYNNSDLFLKLETNYIILKCELKNRDIDPCKANLDYYKNLKSFNRKNEIFYFNEKTLNGYEKFIIFKIIE